ncbi:hypothetical protein N0V91_011132 [Didymella pomorum]|uniref:Uncharacterized protein n=1 Tax=Didymella pomorum TaxID=749634 RepID=A0A9W9D0U0_9PLEO|nr:hypothetical protein N0V91_011132 [Didymella pomorum]
MEYSSPILFLQRTSSLQIFPVCLVSLRANPSLLIKLGLTDTNIPRVRAARSYLKKRDFTIVAHTNTQAGDDPGFNRNVRTCHRLKRNDNVAVVITQADKVTNKKVSARIPYLLDETGRLEVIDTHLQLIKIELTKVQHLIKASRGPNNPDNGLIVELRHKEALYKIHIKHAEILKKEIAVAARNRFKPMMKREHLNKIIIATRETSPNQIRQAKKDLWTIQVLETVLRQTGLPQLASTPSFGARGRGRRPSARVPTGIKIFLMLLRSALDNLCNNGSKVLQDEMTQHMVDVLEQMGSDVRACLDSNQHGVLREFFDNMQKCGKDIEVNLKLARKRVGTERMQTIYGLAYHAPTTKQNRTKYSARTNVFKSVPLVPKIGPYMELKEYIESPVDTHLQSVEAKLLENCETVFSNILHDFENVRPRRRDETPGAMKRRYALGKVVEEAKATFNTDVRAKLLEYGLRLD